MKEKIAIISIIVNLVLAITKVLVGIISKSSSILASGIDSISDIFSSFIGFLGIKMSKKPKDEKHPYGHYKFEVLTGLIITIILFGSGVGIIYQAIKSIHSPNMIVLNYLTLGVMVFSAIINEIMARIKIKIGKEENSLSLLSDGFHSRIDVYGSLAVLIGLFFSKYWIYSDSTVAIIIGLYIIKESLSLGKEATNSLLDVSAGKEIEDKIKEIIINNKIKLSDLKTQKKGSTITANIEIKLPSELNVKDATNKSNKLRDDLIKNINFLEYVSIQIKSHNVSSGFYKPDFGQGFGWNKKGKFKNEIKEAKGLGPGGVCKCPKCGHEQPHTRGKPCGKIKCPKCNNIMERKR